MLLCVLMNGRDLELGSNHRQNKEVIDWNDDSRKEHSGQELKRRTRKVSITYFRK